MSWDIKGPYAIDRFNDRLEIIDAESEVVVAALRGGADNAEVIARANLFAAAPGMLLCLQSMFHENGMAKHLTDDDYARARAAIKAAKGEA